MRLFNFLKRSPTEAKPAMDSDKFVSPYKDATTNLLYNLLFCDDLELFRKQAPNVVGYPFDILFAKGSSLADIQKVSEDSTIDPRIRVLACNELMARGEKPARKQLFAVIIEIGFEEGPDVLAVFNNCTARYINQSGKILVWETTTDETANKLVADIFENCSEAMDGLGPWGKPRRPQPTKGAVRLNFLVSDGLYFGEAAADVLFNDGDTGPLLNAATRLLEYITTKS